MSREFNHVGDEVKKLFDTGIFWIHYTHLSSTVARNGVAKTGKLMAPRIALAHDVMSFIGEPDWRTYLFRAYHVSLTDYDPTGSEHRWRNYLRHANILWTPEQSQEVIEHFREEKRQIEEAPYNLTDFLQPEICRDFLTQLDECITLELLKQERYPHISDDERTALERPYADIYVFGPSLGKAVERRGMFNDPGRIIGHPFVPAEINLQRYLLGMFTDSDVAESKEWISGVVQRDIPVGSIDALATWENTISSVPARSKYVGQQFYWNVRSRRHLDFRQEVIRQVFERL